MKKQILNIGKALSRAEQKEVFGGAELTQEGGEMCSDVCNSGTKVCPTGQECFKGTCAGDNTWMCRVPE